MKNKWILFAVALALIVMNLLNADFTAYKQLSIGDLLPIIVIALVSFFDQNRRPLRRSDRH